MTGASFVREIFTGSFASDMGHVGAGLCQCPRGCGRSLAGRT